MPAPASVARPTAARSTSNVRAPRRTTSCAALTPTNPPPTTIASYATSGERRRDRGLRLSRRYCSGSGLGELLHGRVLERDARDRRVEAILARRRRERERGLALGDVTGLEVLAGRDLQ